MWNVTFLQQKDCKSFQEALNKALVADTKAKHDAGPLVLEVELVNKESMYHFHENKKSPFLKVLNFTFRYELLLIVKS